MERPKLHLFEGMRAPGAFISDSKIAANLGQEKLARLLELSVKQSLVDVDLTQDVYALAPDTAVGRDQLQKANRFCSQIITELTKERVTPEEVSSDLALIGFPTELTNLILQTFAKNSESLKQKLTRTDFWATFTVTSVGYRVDMVYSDSEGSTSHKPSIFFDMRGLTPSGKSSEFQFELNEEDLDLFIAKMQRAKADLEKLKEQMKRMNGAATSSA